MRIWSSGWRPGLELRDLDIINAQKILELMMWVTSLGEAYGVGRLGAEDIL